MGSQLRASQLPRCLSCLGDFGRPLLRGAGTRTLRATSCWHLLCARHPARQVLQGAPTGPVVVVPVTVAGTQARRGLRGATRGPTARGGGREDWNQGAWLGWHCLNMPAQVLPSRGLSEAPTAQSRALGRPRLAHWGCSHPHQGEVRAPGGPGGALGPGRAPLWRRGRGLSWEREVPREVKPHALPGNAACPGPSLGTCWAEASG